MSIHIHLKCKYTYENAGFCILCIDGLHLTSWRPCWRYKIKEYVINSIVGSSRREWLTLSATFRMIDCKPRIDYFKILKNSIKLSKFSMIFHRETSQAPTPPIPHSPPERPYDVSRGQNRYVTFPLAEQIC